MKGCFKYNLCFYSNGLETMIIFETNMGNIHINVDADSDYSFVFMNPNDPDYEPPEEGEAPNKPNK